MATNVLMPQLGETVTEGTLTSWSKAVGDSVQPGDVLFEIETDKTSMEIPATAAGVLAEIRVLQGEVVAVGTVVAVIEQAAAARTSGEAAAEPAATAPAATTPAATTPAPSRPADPFQAVRTPEHHFGPGRLPNGTAITPLARRLASEARISVEQLSGSGPQGRILGRDVEAAAARSQSRPGAPPQRPVGSVTAQYPHTPYEEIALDGMRRQIAQRLLTATQTIPHFYLSVDVDVDALNALRTSSNESAPRAADGTASFKLSLNDFVIKALGNALLRVPEANAVWAEDRILRFRQADIGVAVAIEGGLITPVLRNVQAKSLSAISNEMKELAQRARARRLLPEEYHGGSISISNLGMFGIAEFSAIINPPHAAILAVGAASRVATETGGGAVRFVSRVRVTLSCDHRVIDGVLGAQLLAAFKSALENPVGLLV
jgi:pyruvate dehydrogenase E2 component (dihydrolipoamide acetyltransferase)